MENTKTKQRHESVRRQKYHQFIAGLPPPCPACGWRICECCRVCHGQYPCKHRLREWVDGEGIKYAVEEAANYGLSKYDIEDALAEIDAEVERAERIQRHRVTQRRGISCVRGAK